MDRLYQEYIKYIISTEYSKPVERHIGHKCSRFTQGIGNSTYRETEWRPGHTASNFSRVIHHCKEESKIIGLITIKSRWRDGDIVCTLHRKINQFNLTDGTIINWEEDW
jgi:hypothetical protein